jgi:poly(3-hydroxybutyrate) depolymerase
MKHFPDFFPLLLALATAIMPKAGGAAEPTVAVAAHEHFDFEQAGRHITVWFYVPPDATPQTSVVVVMHGIQRNGEDYLADWIPLAREKGFLLVAPEFSTKEFPGEEGYIYGNTVDKAGRALPREQWSFSVIEPVFDAIRTRTGNRSAHYRLYGHSAGAQFVQRFVYFVPMARAERIVAANAGWYMLPDLSIAFPYGLKNTRVTAADLRHALALPLTVLLGTADVDPKTKALRHTVEADAQGPYRFARGNFFFGRAEEAARKLGLPLVWRLATAPGVAHSDKNMSPFAVTALFPEKP